MGKKENITTEYLEKPEVFADLFNGYVFGGKQIIKPDALRVVDRRVKVFLADDRIKGAKNTYEIIKRERDIVREVEVDGKLLRLAVLGVEQQTNIDYSMALRTLTYDTLEYLKQAKAIEQQHKRKRDVRGNEYLSCFKKEDVLIPTITIVFYTGKEKWDASKDLKGLFGDAPYLEEMIPFMVSSPLNLISVYDVADTSKYHGELRKVFDLLKYVDDDVAMDDFVKKNYNAYSGLDMTTARLLTLLLDMEFDEVVNQDEKDGGFNVCKALEDMKMKSNLKGRAEGRAEGEATVIVNMLNKGMSCEEISALTDVSLERVQQIAQA